jgi:hypothetical protein
VWQIRVRCLPRKGRTGPLCSISATFSQMHHDGVKEINPDFDALLVFLANWEAIERSALGRILTAGQLADVQELERLYALPSEPTEHLSE